MTATPTLGLLSRLDRLDAAGLLAAGAERQVIANTVLVRKGEQPDSLFFVLDGRVDVVVGRQEQRVASLAPGAPFGEMSFLSDQPASADVVARENTLLLEVPREAVRARAARRPAFASTFYRELSQLMAARLRSSTGALQQRLDAASVQATALPGAAQVRKVQARIAAAKRLLVDTDRLALKSGGVVPASRAARVREDFRGLVASLNADLGPDSSLDDVGRRSLGRWVQGELLPFLHASRLGERMYAKPRGYAGDFLTIAQIYEDVGVGTGRLGPLIDRCLLDLPAAQAVRNRRGLLLEEIAAQLAARPAGVTRVTSLASGPAAELFDAFAALDDPTRLQATCIDIDDEALAYVAGERGVRGLDAQMRLEQGNLVYLATGRTTLDLPPQDLIYSIGLIDYFSDAFVVKLLNAIHGLLAPGGQVILGNFHPRNPTRALMDHVLDWKLIHRDEADMDRLFAASAFGGPCARVRVEGEGVNLFAFGRKA